MSKLAELLHELVDAVHGNKGLTPERAGELHALADDVAAALPEPEKAAVEVAADVPGAVEAAMKTAGALVQNAKEQVQAARLALAPNGTLNANLPPAPDPSDAPSA